MSLDGSERYNIYDKEKQIDAESEIFEGYFFDTRESDKESRIDCSENNTTETSEVLDSLTKKLDTFDSINSEEKKTLFESSFSSILGFNEQKTFEYIIASSEFGQYVAQEIEKAESEQITTGNKRKVDALIWDRVNKILPLKKWVYDYFQRHVPYEVLSNDIIEPHDHDYFSYDPKTDKLFLEEWKRDNELVQFDPKIPDSIQYVAVKALLKYPELNGKRFHFTYTDGFTVMKSKQHVMRSQISPISLLSSGLSDTNQRTYLIHINFLEKEGVTTLSNISQEARGGVMTHELAHSLDYDKRSIGNIISFLAAFGLSPKRVRGMERNTDMSAIARGSGYELYQFRKEVHNGSDDAYVDYKKRTYLSPREILLSILVYHKFYTQNILDKVIAELQDLEQK